jgi:hypothetical protein
VRADSRKLFGVADFVTWALDDPKDSGRPQRTKIPTTHVASLRFGSERYRTKWAVPASPPELCLEDSKHQLTAYLQLR